MWIEKNQKEKKTITSCQVCTLQLRAATCVQSTFILDFISQLNISCSFPCHRLCL
uniref:Uncharacterized protein n=1 Tax=Anguilla anguilla TaxID=7936 RepID=A0A0E9R5C7_ANGAN